MLRILYKSISNAVADEGVRAIMLVSFTIVFVSTIFYRWIEGWGWIDAFYFSVITISTVGYGDFSPQTVPGKLFTVGYLVCGIGIFVALVTRFANIVLRDADRHRDTD